MLPADDFASVRPPICYAPTWISATRRRHPADRVKQDRGFFECSCCLKATECRRHAKQTAPTANPSAHPPPKLLMSSYATQTHPGLLSLHSVSVPQQIHPKPWGKCGLPVCKHFAKAPCFGKVHALAGRRGLEWGGRGFTFAARGYNLIEGLASPWRATFRSRCLTLLWVSRTRPSVGFNRQHAGAAEQRLGI